MQLLISMTHWFSCLTGGDICYFHGKSLPMRSLDWWATLPQPNVLPFVFFRGSLFWLKMKNGSCYAEKYGWFWTHLKAGDSVHCTKHRRIHFLWPNWSWTLILKTPKVKDWKALMWLFCTVLIFAKLVRMPVFKVKRSWFHTTNRRNNRMLDRSGTVWIVVVLQRHNCQQHLTGWKCCFQTSPQRLQCRVSYRGTLIVF